MKATIVFVTIAVLGTFLPIANSRRSLTAENIISRDPSSEEEIFSISPKRFPTEQPLSQSIVSDRRKSRFESRDELTKISKPKTSRKNQRLIKFLAQFDLNFSRFDSTCIKRKGRGIPAPQVKEAHVFKYVRRRNPAHPKNRYGMALYECNPGYAFPSTSADRMFCSRNKWVGPRPVCLPQESLEDESECSQCQQICNRDGSLATCLCYSGYEMVNGSCTDINECQSDNGGCSGNCVNKPGSFQCFCTSGYQLSPDGRSCIDRNECILRNGRGPCQDTCNNTNGSYICGCDKIPGTKLASDKHSCEDINECNENNFGCSHICLNTFGNAFCSCPKGLILSTSDYKTCLPESNLENRNRKTTQDGHGVGVVIEIGNFVNPSQIPLLENSNELSLLLNTENTAAPVSTTPTTPIPLDCPPGSEPDPENLQICVEHEDCSARNGGCDHICVPSGSFRFCSCRIGHELLNETNCVDVNECEQENGGCEQLCLNTHGSFQCDCKSGYELADDGRNCQAIFCDEPPVISSTTGWDCELPTGVELSSQRKPPSSSECRLQCRPGFVPHHKESTPSVVHHRFLYEIINAQPGQIQKPEQVVIKCLSNGEWSLNNKELNSISCVRTTCSPLSLPEHGTLFPEVCLAEDGAPVRTQCLVLCSAGYFPRNGRIRTCSKSLKWFPEEEPICIKLPPTPRPHIHCPSDLVADLKAGQSSTHVVIPQPQANMDWYRYVESDPAWAKSLEWDVPAGVTQVVFTARSPITNDTASCNFKIHIVDREAPRVQGCPTSFEIRLSAGETSKEVWWSEPKFSDNVKLHYVQQSHTPGLVMNPGVHHVHYVAGDAEANKARCSFAITVHDAAEYEMSDRAFFSKGIMGRHKIICPNLKTGRWNIHFAYYLPPGCRYHSQSPLFKPFKNGSSRPTSRQLLRRSATIVAQGRRRIRHTFT